jgi:hypothetical protein
MFFSSFFSQLFSGCKDKRIIAIVKPRPPILTEATTLFKTAIQLLKNLTKLYNKFLGNKVWILSGTPNFVFFIKTILPPNKIILGNTLKVLIFKKYIKKICFVFT